MVKFNLKALTDIWTGEVEGKGGELHLTGIRGSLRWWYEVLIRGLDRYACDPNDENFRCSLDIPNADKKKIKEGESKLEDYVKGKICPVCYMFGCTGWGGKFVLRIRDEAAGTLFVLEFIEKKKFEPEEVLLLKMALKLIIDYGAIGGRTVLKPADKIQPNKNKKRHHLDYGLIERGKDNIGQNISNVPRQDELIYKNNENKIKEYLNLFNISKVNKPEWPDLRNFWFVNGDYIDGPTHNIIVSRDIGNPKEYEQSATSLQRWLGGKEGESKKIFSFHGLVEDPNNPAKMILSFLPRCFGYAKRSELDKVIKLIESNTCLKGKIKRGKEVLLNEL